MLQMCSSLRPTRMTCMYFEPASIKRDEVVHLMQFVDLNTELFRQIEIVRRHLVLGVVAAADLAVAAGDASGAPRSNSAEVRIFRLDTRVTEVDSHRSLVERFSSPHVDRDLAHIPIDVRRHVRLANNPEHPPSL